MKKGGTGGSHTKGGLNFEEEVDILTIIKKLPKKDGYVVKNNDVWYKNTLIARVLKKHEVYKQYLELNGVDWRDCVSKQLLPDNCVILENKDRVIIVEVKYQSVVGSVDEKLQTCAFKKMEYEKIFKKLNKKIDFYYCLNDYFKNEKYKDVLDYIVQSGCKYYFNEIPCEDLGLK